MQLETVFQPGQLQDQPAVVIEASQLEYLADDVELRRAAAKTLKGFCLTYLPHHFPLDPSDFFDEMCAALESSDINALG